MPMLCAMRKMRRWYSSCISSIRAFRFWKYSGCSSVDKRGASSWPPHSWPRADPTRERCGCRGHKCHHAFTRVHCEWPSTHHHEQSSLSRGSSTPASSPSPCEPSCFPPCMGGLATNPRLTGPDPPVVGGCPNCLVPHVAVIHQVLHQGVQVTYGQREQVGIRSVVFSCQPFPALVLVTMFSGKPCSLVAPARGSGSMHPMRTGVQGGVVPASCLCSKGACPRVQCPSLPGHLGSLQNQSLLETRGHLSTCREHVASPDIPRLSSSHLPACSDPGIPRSRSCRSQARGCALPEHWTFSERFGCTPPCGDRTESSRRAVSPMGDTGLGWRSLAGSLDLGSCFQVWCGWGGGPVPSQRPHQSAGSLGQEALIEWAVAAPSPCGPRQGGSISSGC